MKVFLLKKISILLSLVFIFSLNLTKAGTYMTTDYYAQPSGDRGQNYGDDVEFVGNGQGGQGSVYNDANRDDGCSTIMEITFSTNKLNYKIGEDVYPVLNVSTRENTCGLSMFGNGLYSSYDSNSNIELLSSPISLDSFTISDTYEISGGEDATPLGKYKLQTFGTPFYSSYRTNYPLVLTDSVIPSSVDNKADLLLLFGKPIFKNSRIQDVEISNETLYVNGNKYSTPFRMPSGPIPYKNADEMLNDGYQRIISSSNQSFFSYPLTTDFNVISSDSSPKIFVR